MRNVRIVARLDVKGESLIKGIHLEGLRVLGKPKDFAEFYFKNGIDEIIYMDSVASLYKRNSLKELLKETVKNVFVPITVAGGIRSVEDAKELLRSGADKIAINTAAVENPHLLTAIANKFGSQCVVLSVEAKRRGNYWEAFTNNGREPTGLNVLDWCQKCCDLGAGEILLTSVDQDGTKRGFDLELVESVVQLVDVPVIASGGMGKLEDMTKLVLKTNVQAVAIGSFLHYKIGSIEDIKNSCEQNAISIRSI